MNIQEIILDQIDECKRLEEYNYYVGIILPSRDELKKINISQYLLPLLDKINGINPYHRYEDEIIITTYNRNQITISSMDIMNEMRSGMLNKIFVSNSVSKADINHLKCFIHSLARKDHSNNRSNYLPTPIEILPIEI